MSFSIQTADVFSTTTISSSAGPGCEYFSCCSSCCSFGLWVFTVFVLFSLAVSVITYSFATPMIFRRCSTRNAGHHRDHSRPVYNIDSPFFTLSVSIVGSLRDREVACSASDRQGSNFKSCVWRTMSSHSSHHPQEVLLDQFSLYVHKGGLKPDSFHFIFSPCRCEFIEI